MSGGGGGRDDGFPSTPISTRIGGAKSGSGAGGGTGESADPCDIVQRAPLNSPVPAVVARIVIGDILQIILQHASTRPILEVRLNGNVAGALTHTGHVEIIRCIQQGNTYVAEVLARSGGSVDLQIRRA